MEAGADALMILDLRAPATISPEDFREFSLPYLRRLVNAVKSTGVPVMLHSDGTSFLSTPISEFNVDVLGLSWTVDLAEAMKKFGGKQVVQGNLDPYLLFAQEKVIEEKVRNIVETGKSAPAHIFSLGGWIIPTTPFEKVKFLVDLVHSL